MTQGIPDEKPVTIREVYQLISEIDSKLDRFMEETYNRRVKCENRFATLETRQTILFTVFTGSIVAALGMILGMVV